MFINEAVARWAHEAGVPVMVNPAPAAPVSPELFRCATFFSPNEHEAAAMAGHPIHVDDAGANEDDLRAVADIFREKGVENLIVTLGGNGSVAVNKDGVARVQSVKMPVVADTTAAGDSFVASFSTLWCAGLPARQALAFASHAAAITVSRPGAIPSLPTLAEVTALLRERGYEDMDYDLFGTVGGGKQMKNEGKTALAHLTASAEKEFCAFLAQQTPEAYEDAVALIEECRAAGHRVHVTGIGKPGHVAGYGASLLSSTGTPSYFLHGTEAVHGSCGQLEEGDVVIAISNSGETGGAQGHGARREEQRLPRHRHHRQCGKLARKGERRAAARACRRRGRPAQPRAPRNSVLAEMFVLQALSAILQADVAQTPAQYVRRHPGGALGKIRDNER